MENSNLWRYTKKTLPVLIGAGLGYAYYYFVGCYSGTCPITSNPFISTLYGGLIGLLMVFPGKSKRKRDEQQNN